MAGYGGAYKGSYESTDVARMPANRMKEGGGPLTNINGPGLSKPNKATSKGGYRARAASLLRKRG